MAFRGRLVSVGAGAVAESIELLEGNIIYGRKDFAPHENRLSRSVCETNFSPNSGRLTVTLVPLYFTCEKAGKDSTMERKGGENGMEYLGAARGILLPSSLLPFSFFSLLLSLIRI